MKLEVGMYVRTNKGEIAKIVADAPYLVNIDKFKKDGITLRTLRKIDILKASYNIIDILEAGDYVNGYPIDEIIEYEDNTKAIIIDDIEKTFIQKEQDIKSVITHEQMEQMAYKVGE